MNYHHRDPFAHTAFAQDRADFRSAASAFKRAAKLVKSYGSRLRRIARHIDNIIRHYDPATAEGQALMQAGLLHYRAELQPYAEASAEKMVAEVAKANEQDWRKMSAEVGRGIEREVAQAHIAPAMAKLREDQIKLIRSLPTEAAERVNRVVVEGLSKGTRAETLAKEILETGRVTRARCDTIARTETSRAATTLTQARAEHIGSDGYIWRSSKDGTTRPSHRAMEGKFVRWDSPPTLDGLTGHCGCLPRCRCYCEVVVPD